MKYILISTVTILLMKDFGHFLLPQIFTNFAVQVSLAVLFAIVVPIGFSKSLVIYLSERNKSVKKIGDTFFYLLIFLAALLAPVTTIHIKNSFLLTNKSFPDHAISILEAPVSMTQEKGRIFAARSIFKEYGKKVPYKLATGRYSIFQPTEQDIEDYDKRKKQKEEMEQLFSKLANQSKISGYLSFLYIFSFLLLTPVTLLYEKNKLSKIS